jgi:uncharacterized protein YqhQ
MSSTEPRYMGGQAVVEGVMMRGAHTWAVAVRGPDGDIEVVTHDVPNWSERWSRLPVVRGVAALGESLGLGFKALAWSAERQVPEDERISSKAMGWTMAIALIFFTGVFILLPTLVNKGLTSAFGVTGIWYHLIEGAIRLAIFIGYLVLIAQLKDIKRVFEYHGAEHKSIAAYENGAELTPESAQQFSTEHVRCGTNFLLTVMLVTIVVYAFVGRPSLPYLILSRIVLIPVVAGLSYEVIRFAAKHMDRRWVRIAMRPGLALQRLTTRQPNLDQLEVAIASLKAAMTAEQLAEVAARSAAPARGLSSSPRPAFGTA